MGDGKNSRWFRNPSIQFFASLILAPILGIFGEAVGARGSFIAIAGWFSTFLLIGFTAKRNYRYERAQLPPGNLFSLRGENNSMLNYLVGVYTLWLFLLAGTLITGVLLLLKIVEIFFGN